MRAVVLGSLLLLGACTLDLFGGGDDGDGDDDDDDGGGADARPVDAARAPCEVGPRYRMPHVDCGPTPEPPPPDLPPCFWTLTLDPTADPGRVQWCYTDVCEVLEQICAGGTVTAWRQGSAETFTGTLQPDGVLRWEADGQVGDYAPY